MTPRTGRPPSDNPRCHTIRYRVTEAEMDLLVAAAASLGVPPAAYARQRALVAAHRDRRRDATRAALGDLFDDSRSFWRDAQGTSVETLDPL